jgi:alkaline phosphatase D
LANTKSCSTTAGAQVWDIVRIVPNDELRRRLFLARSGQYLALTAVTSWWTLGQPPAKNPFTLGVASGDPEPDGVVLWTRLAPDPLHGGGMPRERVEVEWRVAEDERMSRVVARGRTVAPPDLAHSVHVEVRGLRPGRWYWYRFKAGVHESTIGRTRTAPERRGPADRLRFAFASCQQYEVGYYTAYQHMAEEDLDLVIHLGDYIYESGPASGRPRTHNSPEPFTLEDYRNRHSLYKLDPDLQRAHALFPWLITWDDHEVDNNYASAISQDNAPRAEFLEKRANAYQAYYEHMPLRKAQLPKGSSLTLYRRIAFGDLAEFSMLDTRQYRSDQPCQDGTRINCALAADPSQTILGPEQERWFLGGLARSRARWNIVGNQVPIGAVDRAVGPEVGLSMDKWDGYQVARDRVVRFLHERRISNPVVITGDVHANWAVDVKLDWKDQKSPVVASEFVGTSITSGGDGSPQPPPAVHAFLPENPQVRFFNAQRGYVRCIVTQERWQTDYRVVPYVARPGAPVETKASFVLENRRAGIQKA